MLTVRDTNFPKRVIGHLIEEGKEGERWQK